MKYSVRFNDLMSKKPDNLIFRIRGMPRSYEKLQDLEEKICGIIEAKSVEEIIIDWEWPYETGYDASQIAKNDKEDTDEGGKLESYKFQIIVTGEEVI